MINLTLTDDHTTHTFELLEPPIPEQPVEASVDVVTLDNYVSTYFTANRRLWTQQWAFMDESEWLILKGFYDRQFTTFKYPRLTLEKYNVTNLSVRMTLESGGIIDNCGTREGVVATWREAR